METASFCLSIVVRIIHIGVSFGAAISLIAASRFYPSLANVKPVLTAPSVHLPAELRNANEAKWVEWSRKEDAAIRARLHQGDLDSLVNFLLYGTSFTSQPRIRMESIAEASKSGVLRTRVDDLVANVRKAGGNERLLFLRELLRSEGIDPGGDSSRTGVFILKQLERVLEEQRSLAERAREIKPETALDRGSLFRYRGVSLDTGLLADFAIDQTLRDLKTRGLLRAGQIARVGVIGPGLDFIDKNPVSAYDFYPPQTIQPFALYDSLLQIGLAKDKSLALSILDISPRIADHLRRTRERAAKGAGYVIQLPRDVGRAWPPGLVAYWNTFGGSIGSATGAIPPPSAFLGLETRAVRIRPDVVLTCEAVDLDIIVDRLDLRESEKFDLLVATNIFVYYDTFEQMLALENAGSMLKPGGLLLTNDGLPEVGGGSMRLAGATEIQYDDRVTGSREIVGWYQKR